MVVESVSERVDVNTDAFAECDRAAEPDAILATNFSSLPRRLIVDKVQPPERVLNPCPRCCSGWRGLHCGPGGPASARRSDRARSDRRR
jgi:hypothetical protein